MFRQKTAQNTGHDQVTRNANASRSGTHDGKGQRSTSSNHQPPKHTDADNRTARTTNHHQPQNQPVQNKDVVKKNQKQPAKDPRETSTNPFITNQIQKSSSSKEKDASNRNVQTTKSIAAQKPTKRTVRQWQSTYNLIIDRVTYFFTYWLDCLLTFIDCCLDLK